MKSTSILALVLLSGCAGDWNLGCGKACDTDTDPDPDTDLPGDTDTDLPPDTDPIDTSEVVPHTDEETDVAPGTDADADTVDDAHDVCPGLDDRVDLNADATPDCAQTLVANPQFATQIAPWVASWQGSNVATASFDATHDASGWSRSGSAAVINTTPMTAANASGLITECITGNPGEVFDVWYRVYVDSAHNLGTGVQVITSFLTYSDSACAVPAASSTPGPPPTAFDTWHVIHPYQGLEMWPNWHSFEMQITLFKPGTSADIPFSIDDVLILPPN